MRVFGDATRREPVARKLHRLRGLLDAARELPPSIARHGLLAEALIEAGELWQGVADARFHAADDRDDPHPAPPVAAATALTVALARRCAASWRSGFAHCPAEPTTLLAACERLLAGESIEVKQPEGYAFYALYPEAYFMVATAFVDRAKAHPCRVIGLRSIGTSLCAMVAAAVDDPAPLSVRPVGPPFARQLAWTGAWPVQRGEHHAIVDEGPGLSGSSMGAVALHLAANDVAASHIHLFPGHANGPGAEATPQLRALWSSVDTHVVGFDALVLKAHAPAHRLHTWVEEIVGPLQAPLQDISGTRLLPALPQHGRDAVVVHPWQDRRKFLARSASRTWLVKFAGLGQRARERVACARMLGEAGLCAQVAGLCHGFLVERWHGDMVPLSRAHWRGAVARDLLLARLAQYIAFRALHLPAPPEGGASLDDLADMARHNSAEAFGGDMRQAWEAHRAQARALRGGVRRVRTDNRLHAWEWIARDGALLKTDAIDHHAGHDLIGCQDPAWDVAGAVAEFALRDDDEAVLLAHLGRNGCEVDPALVDLYRPAYLAFQLGHFRLAAAGAADAALASRLSSHAASAYEAPLRAWLGHAVRHG